MLETKGEQMTKAEYIKYEEAVKRNLDGLRFVSTGSCPGCNECGLSDNPTDHERECAEYPDFSWSRCEACGSRLGGDRHPAHYVDSNNEICHMRICSDCLVYLNYGKLDDMAMIEMENS
jgi:hypothetical protein